MAMPVPVLAWAIVVLGIYISLSTAVLAASITGGSGAPNRPANVGRASISTNGKGPQQVGNEEDHLTSIVVPTHKISGYRKIMDRLLPALFTPDGPVSDTHDVFIPDDNELIVSIPISPSKTKKFSRFNVPGPKNDNILKKKIRFVCRSRSQTSSSVMSASFQAATKKRGVLNEGVLGGQQQNHAVVSRVYEFIPVGDKSEEGNVPLLKVTFSGDSGHKINAHPANSLPDEENCEQTDSDVARDRDSLNINVDVELAPTKGSKSTTFLKPDDIESIRSSLISYFTSKLDVTAKLLLARASASEHVKKQSNSIKEKQTAIDIERMANADNLYNHTSSKHGYASGDSSSSRSDKVPVQRYQPSSECQARRTRKRGG
jgi:hypothetical protein